MACLDPAGREIARGLVNYGNEEVERIKGQHTQRIAELLGYVDEPELIHRDSLLVDAASSLADSDELDDDLLGDLASDGRLRKI